MNARAIQHLLAFCLVLLLSGCATLETLVPQSPKEAVAASYLAIETLADTAGAARAAGYLDAEARATVKAKLTDAREATDSARRAIDRGLLEEGRSALARASTATTLVRDLLEDFRQ